MSQEQGHIAILASVTDAPQEVITELVAENECAAMGQMCSSTKVEVVSEYDEDGFVDTNVRLTSEAPGDPRDPWLSM
jgi:hypothetical protein